MDKKAINLMMKTTIYIILVVVVFFAIYLSVSRIGSQVGVYEQIYAKQIALAIDKAKPGTDVLLDISDLYSVANENKFRGNVVEILNDENKVVVRLIEGRGYSFNFFNSADVIWELKEKDKKLFLGVR